MIAKITLLTGNLTHKAGAQISFEINPVLEPSRDHSTGKASLSPVMRLHLTSWPLQIELSWHVHTGAPVPISATRHVVAFSRFHSQGVLTKSLVIEVFPCFQALLWPKLNHRYLDNKIWYHFCFVLILCHNYSGVILLSNYADVALTRAAAGSQSIIVHYPFRFSKTCLSCALGPLGRYSLASPVRFGRTIGTIGKVRNTLLWMYSQK